jgi:hypothetical protein
MNELGGVVVNKTEDLDSIVPAISRMGRGRGGGVHHLGFSIQWAKPDTRHQRGVWERVFCRLYLL